MRSEATDQSSIVLPVELAHALAAARSEVSTLERIFGRFQAPRTLAEWETLPTTGRADYVESKSVGSSVRTLDRLFAPAAPFNLSSPSFPVTVLHSYADKVVLDERLSSILSLLGCGTSEDFLLVSGRSQRYFAADLAELLIALGHGCVSMLFDQASTNNVGRLRALEAKYLFWIHARPIPEDLLPETVRGVVTFNRHPRLGRVAHVDVLHLDEVPLLAFGGALGKYSFLSSHFYLECFEGKLLVTTLRQDMLPLIRYRTGWCLERNMQGEILVLEDV